MPVWVAEAVAAADSPASLYESMPDGYDPGAQRAFVLARLLCDHDMWVTDGNDALDAGDDVLVVPDALNTLLTVG